MTISQLLIVSKDPSANFFAESGPHSAAVLEGTVLMKLSSKLKNPRISLEFRGVSESRWEFGGRLAQKPESPSYKVTRNMKVFHKSSDLLHDSKELTPNPMGDAITFPFRLSLPHNRALPSSYESNSGSVFYSLKCTVLYQDGLLSKSTKEVDVPVIMQMAEPVKEMLLSTQSDYASEVHATADTAAYTVHLQSATVLVGASVEVDLGIFQTPGHTKLRMFRASLRLAGTFTNDQENTTGNAKYPRPLSEVSQAFPLVKIGGIGGSEPVRRQFQLYVDPELATPTFEAPLISIKTVLRLEIILDNSESANVTVEVPILVVPPLKNRRNFDGGDRLRRVDSIPDSIYSMASMATTSTKRSNSIGAPLSPPVNWSEHAMLHELPLLSLEKLERAKSARRKMSVLQSEMEQMELHSSSQYRASQRYSVSGEAGPVNWSPEMVLQWIQQFDPSADVVQAFHEHQIDGGILVNMTDDDLKNALGITSLGFRRKVLLAIGKLM
ncbi:hypothetical protein HDU81_009663 [Chytriomyces hyalinus]|nr:hypothetical protein HDU81_009663 [Chytriomyces hyalinus]